MRRLGLERDIVDEAVRDRAADRCRSAGRHACPPSPSWPIPTSMPDDVAERLAGVDPDAPTRATCSASTGSTTPTGAGRTAVPEHLVLPAVADRRRRRPSSSRSATASR